MFSAQELSEHLAKAREAERWARARGAVQDKHWSWVFGTLWTGLRRSPRLHLCVPDTILFEDGAPTKWLGSDADGYLARKDLTPPGARLYRSDRGGEGQRIRDEFFAFERIKLFRAAFEDAQRLQGALLEEPSTASERTPPTAARGGPAVCVAEYIDGVREELSGPQLEYLGSHQEWRVQVRALQALVGAQRYARGVYDRDAKASLAPRAEAVAAAAAAIAAGEPEHVSRDDLSHLASALAKFAESTYAPAATRAAELAPGDPDAATMDDLGLEVVTLKSS